LAAVPVSVEPFSTTNDEVPIVPFAVNVQLFDIVTTALPKEPVTVPLDVNVDVTMVAVSSDKLDASVECSDVADIVPAPDPVFPFSKAAVAVIVEPDDTTNVAVPIVGLFNVSIYAPDILHVAFPRFPVNAISDPIINDAVTIDPVILLKSAANVSSISVTCVVPAPDVVLAFSFAAVPTSVEPDSITNVAVPIVAFPIVNVLDESSVIVLAPKFPVNVPDPELNAVLVVDVIDDKSAFRVLCKAVTDVVPSPDVVFPVSNDAGPVNVEPSPITNVAEPIVVPESVIVPFDDNVIAAEPREPVKVPEPANAAVTVFVDILLKSAANVE
jgi:hypothetical protein